MNRFLCPYCQAQLNVGGHLVLSVHCKNGTKGVVLLSDELGNYSADISDNLKFNEGDHIHFHCPACSHSLEYKENKNLARVLKEDKGVESTIVFSAIFGEQSTYQINEERTLTFGEHALRYTDPDWYRKN